MTQALYTAILVFTVSLGLVHTRVVRRTWVVAAFPDPLVDLCVQGEVVSDGGAKVHELMDRIQLIVIDGDGRWRLCTLPQDVRRWSSFLASRMCSHSPSGSPSLPALFSEG